MTMPLSVGTPRPLTAWSSQTARTLPLSVFVFLFVQRTVLAAVGSDNLKGRGVPTDEVITAYSSGLIETNF
jgi:hypothetical protein